MKKLIAFMIVSIMCKLSYGNGANGFFINQLERGENNIEGYSVHYVPVDSGAHGEIYCYSSKLEKLSKLISIGKEEIFSLKDVVSISADVCQAPARWLKFNKKNTDSRDLLILNPVNSKAKELTNIKSIPLESVSQHFDLFKKNGITLKENLQIEDQYINFLAAYDLNLDGSPDLLVFSHSVNYTHTYLIGKKAAKWVILKIEYPL